MIRSFLTFLLILLFPLRIFAFPVFSSLLPNPLGDDILGEYIEIRNTGCSTIDISGYEVRDLQKGFFFPSGTKIESKTNLRLEYAQSKISLNNSGLETIFLKNTSGSIVDVYSYSGTQKDNVILSIQTIDDTCEIGTISESTGSQDLASGSIDSTTGVILSPDDIDSLEKADLVVSGEILTGTAIVEQTGITVSNSSGSLIGSGIYIDSSGATLNGSGIIEGSGMILTGEILGSTGGYVGSSPDSGTTIVQTETGKLIPIELSYSDEDANGRIDTLEILYPYVLTGSVNIDSIFLYSQTGGLYTKKINTETGYILSGSLSGNLLLLSLKEGDIDKLELHISNSTSSDLRLKSTGDLGFHSLGGQSSESFFLTTSFDNYQNVIYTEYVYESDAESEISQSETGSEVRHQVIFPIIIPILQSPTNASFLSGGFICSEPICRINMTLVPIFSSGFNIKDFGCYFGTGEILSPDSDCNPDTYYFSSSGVLIIKLVSHIDPLQYLEERFPISFPSHTVMQDTAIRDTNPPVIVLEHDGRGHAYYKFLSEYELECYTSTCVINLTAENSYDREGGNVRYIWMYDMGDFTLKKDPGEKKFTFGDHVIWLRVIDESENMSQVYFHIHVLGDHEKENKNLTENKTKTKKLSQNSKEQKKKKTKKKKMKKFSFFEPPEIILQSTNSKTKTYTDFLCISTSKTCSFNFTLSGTTKNILYTWQYDDGTKITTKNPRSKTLQKGDHSIVLMASYSANSDPIWEKTFNVQVKQIKKSKKAKVPKKKSLKKPKRTQSSKKKIQKIGDNSGINFLGKNNGFPFEFIFFILGAIFIMIFYRNIIPKLSTFREQDADTERNSH